MSSNQRAKGVGISLVVLTACLSATAHAQEAPAGGAVAAIENDEIVVTARKRDENVQEVPLAVTAYSAEALEALGYRNLTSLSSAMPNVALEPNGSMRGYANFSIRGLSINAGIPSIDPTVGLFVDGVYQGIPAGQLLDNFDIEAVEVLRGPQGVLFGRNVTGGAVLLRTARPGDEWVRQGRAAIESGFRGTGTRYVGDFTVSGPLNDQWGAKLAAYYSDDGGWNENRFTGDNAGAERQFVIHPMLTFEPTDGVEFLLRLEYGESDGDGPVSQNQAIWSRDGFDTAYNYPGYGETQFSGATLETNIDVPFGNGTVTNILGYRQYEQETGIDIDGTTNTVFHILLFTDQNQFSEELRYAGTFGPVDVTGGLFYFTQDLFFMEQRTIGPNVTAGGGEGTFDSSAAFLALDWHLDEQWTLNLAARYTEENKEADISTVRAGGGVFDSHTITPDFSSNVSWTDLSPRVGVQWEPSDDTNVYAYYARGFRSGGYNFRHTDPGTAPIPTDAEAVDTIEFGLKQRFENGVANLALFHTTVEDIQRQVNLPSTLSGVTQFVVNAGDAEINGAEFELRYTITPNLLLNLQAGYLDGRYTKVIYDLNDDGVINGGDEALEIPGLSPWTYGASLTWDLPVSTGLFSSRLAYSHRDLSYYSDNNVGFFAAADLVDASISYAPESAPWEFRLYGQNLLNENTHGNNTLLPDVPSFGGDGAAGPRPYTTLGFLTRGRVIGAEMRLSF